MLGATIHSFLLSLQTPLYVSDENKANGSLCVNITKGNETLGAPIYKENPNHFYPQVHKVDNPMPIVQIHMTH